MGTPFLERRTWRRVRLSLVRERAEHSFSHPRAVRHGGDVAALLREFLGEDPRERFAVVYLDTRHRPIAVHEAHVGTCDGVAVHPREVFGPALLLAATSIVAAHTHPSGDPSPSAEDRLVTDRLRDAGMLLGIQLLDHLVIGSERYYSFADEGFHVVVAGGAP
jgi:DNA repair protein RadC